MQFVLFGDDMSDNESNGTTSAEDHITNNIKTCGRARIGNKRTRRTRLK